jgi:hypothetical protein
MTLGTQYMLGTGYAQFQVDYFLTYYASCYPVVRLTDAPQYAYRGQSFVVTPYLSLTTSITENASPTATATLNAPTDVSTESSSMQPEATATLR